MDYGFHAPTVSFPVAGTLMVEPTESEPKDELDRFCDAMIAIRARDPGGRSTARPIAKDNVLKNAPHTAGAVAADDVDASRTRASRRRSRCRSCAPTSSGRPSGGSTIPYGDRNLICSCPPMEAYETVSA